VQNALPEPHPVPVVIGERDPEVFERAARALRRLPAHYDPIHARDGVQAYKAIQIVRPALAIVAADLTAIDGAMIVASLGRSPLHRHRPFLGLAAPGDEAAVRRFLECGARVVLPKSFGEDELRLVVDETLNPPPSPAGPAPILLVCTDEPYRAALADALSTDGDRVVCASIAVFALARARCERPRAVILVEPVIGLDPAAFLVRLRGEGIDAPVLLIGERPRDVPGLRYLGRRRAPDASGRVLRGQLGERAPDSRQA
jgi:DNA-binding response OmpR family regulator